MNRNTLIVLTALAVLAVGGIGLMALQNRDKAAMENKTDPAAAEMMKTQEETMVETDEMMGEIPADEMMKTQEETMVETDEMMEEIPAAAPKMMNQGNPAPAFELMDVQGATHSLAELKGQKVYIKFWASWCSICLAGLDDINTLAMEDTGFTVLTIVSPGFSGEQNREDFIKWYSGLEGMKQTVLLDDGGAVARAYGVRAYPTSAYIGSDGILIKSLPGHKDNDSIKDAFAGIN